MTNKVKGFTVTLDEDMRDDDFESILTAVRMIKGVIHVEPTLVTSEDHMNRQLIKSKMLTKMFKLLHEQ